MGCSFRAFSAPNLAGQTEGTLRLLYLEDVDVRLQHDDPHARRRKLCLTVVEVCRNVPESYADEEAVDHMQDKLCSTQKRKGGQGQSEVRPVGHRVLSCQSRRGGRAVLHDYACQNTGR